MPTPRLSRKPFVQALADVAEGKGPTELARLSRQHGPGVSQGQLSRVLAGTEVASAEVAAAVAAAVGVAPEYFVEYRLAAARHAFDVRRPGGFQAALQALDEWHGRGAEVVPVPLRYRRRGG